MCPARSLGQPADRVLVSGSSVVERALEPGEPGVIGGVEYQGTSLFDQPGDGFMVPELEGQLPRTQEAVTAAAVVLGQFGGAPEPLLCQAGGAACRGPVGSGVQLGGQGLLRGGRGERAVP